MGRGFFLNLLNFRVAYVCRSLGPPAALAGLSRAGKIPRRLCSSGTSGTSGGRAARAGAGLLEIESAADRLTYAPAEDKDEDIGYRPHSQHVDIFLKESTGGVFFSPRLPALPDVRRGGAVPKLRPFVWLAYENGIFFNEKRVCNLFSTLPPRRARPRGGYLSAAISARRTCSENSIGGHMLLPRICFCRIKTLLLSSSATILKYCFLYSGSFS